MSTIHIPTFYPDRLAEHFNDAFSRLKVSDMSARVVTGQSGRPLCEITRDDYQVNHSKNYHRGKTR